jgi:hypothetical protein
MKRHYVGRCWNPNAYWFTYYYSHQWSRVTCLRCLKMKPKRVSTKRGKGC